MNLGKNKDTFIFGSGVFILLAAIIALSVIQTRQVAASPNQSAALEIQSAMGEISSTPSPSATAVIVQTEDVVSEMNTSSGDVETDIYPGLTSHKLDFFVVRLPDGATAEDSRVVLSLREPDILSLANNPGWVHLLMANIDLTDKRNMLLASNRLTGEIEVCFGLAGDILSDYQNNPSLYRIEIFNSESNPVDWEPLPTNFHTDLNLLCGTTRTASLYALAVNTPVSEP